MTIKTFNCDFIDLSIELEGREVSREDLISITPYIGEYRNDLVRVIYWSNVEKRFTCYDDVVHDSRCSEQCTSCMDGENYVEPFTAPIVQVYLNPNNGMSVEDFMKTISGGAHVVVSYLDAETGEYKKWNPDVSF